MFDVGHVSRYLLRTFAAFVEHDPTHLLYSLPRNLTDLLMTDFRSCFDAGSAAATAEAVFPVSLSGLPQPEPALVLKTEQTTDLSDWKA